MAGRFSFCFAGIVRSRASRTLYHCATKIASTVKPVYLELKQKIQDKVIQILQNVGGEWQCTKGFNILHEYWRTRQALVAKIRLKKWNTGFTHVFHISGDCHLERLIIKLPALANIEVIKDQTFGDFVGYMAKDIQTRIEPLTTGGSSIDCTIDHTDVARKLRQLTSYLETGYKETLEQNFPQTSTTPKEEKELKKDIKKFLETRFANIVEDVENLMREFENGETKKCFMRLYSKY